MAVSNVRAKVWNLAKLFDGKPTMENFELIEEDMKIGRDDLKTGEVVFEAEWFSVDPYLRVENMQGFKAGVPMHGTQVAKVISTRNGKYPLGTYVVINSGWRTFTKVNPDNLPQQFGGVQYLPELGSLPRSVALGACGMPGVTAYFGFLEICQPKAGEVVVVNAAAGAVGSLVGQIAKIKGCTVIGYAGTPEKVEWIKSLGFDHAFNYKTESIGETLSKAAPGGVDCYFDNVGGDFSAEVISRMKLFGRISICGAISMYNENWRELKAPIVQIPMLFKQLKMEGFIVARWADRWYEAAHQMAKWIQEGKIQYREHKTEGFENIPKAFFELFEGKNTGKAVISV